MPFAFDQLVKFLRRAFERHPADRVRTGDAKHLCPDRKAKVGTPLDVLGRAGERKAEFTELFDIHLSVHRASAR